MDVIAAENTLRAIGVELGAGLTDDEIEAAEAAYDLRFPPDLRELLMRVLPIGRRWPDWRDTESKNITDRLAWPLEGICFDIENNVFWPDEWGIRPTLLSRAFEVAESKVKEAPTLVPIYSHRYIPAEPLESGNPIFSVHQTDIIYYGANLDNYFDNEFRREQDGSRDYCIPEKIKPIPFWTWLVERFDDLHT